MSVSYSDKCGVVEVRKKRLEKEEEGIIIYI